jgi:hypothetical protein
MKPAVKKPFPSSIEDLEAMIRRVLREELANLLERSRIEIALEDESLARDALAILVADRDRPEAWVSWEQAKAEIASAEAAGELPD